MRQRTFMKKSLFIFGLIAALGLQSCNMDNNDNDYSKVYANAVVTVKPQGETSVIQLDDNTQLTPTNISKQLYSKEVRALANLSDVNTTAKTVFVNWIDTILTKPTATNYDLKNDSAYGKDPVEIVNSFETVAEDGYLTLRFRTYWGNNKQHSVNLVHRTDANTPYLLDFYHNANGDSNIQVNDGIVAFRLPEAFNQGNDTINITLRWKSFQKQASGDSIKTINFKYFPRKD